MGEAVRVLHVLGNTNLGGAESRIMDLYRHTDRNRVQFDFLVHSGEEGFYEKEIRELGGRIFRVPRFRIYNYFSYRKALKEFFQEHHEFALIQGHMTSTAAIYLPIAKKAGVKKTAAHARSAGVDKGLKGTMTRFLRRNLADKADYLFTCSELAGISVYGEKAVREGKTIFIPNAIDCAGFTFDPKKRKKMREELGLADALIIGHVGRFHYAKNHEYLIRVFAKLCQMGTGACGSTAENGTDQNYHLILLGEGPLMEDTRKLAEELGIGEITLTDILKELEKPARDPREDMPKPILRSDVLEMKDLTPGMVLKGTVRNVIDFGAFVDIGVHQDGLVHISQMTDRYIKHPLEAVSVGDIVEVKVLGVDMAKKRISLTMKL
mgnify:CR=1 FL=1